MNAAMTFLRGTGLCATMSELELEAFASFLVSLEAGKGRLIFRRGDPGNRIYIVKEGCVVSSLALPDGSRRELSRFGPGRFFGEMAIVGGEPRSADCLAVEDSQLLALEAIDFYRLVWDHPMIGVKMLRAMSAVLTGWLAENGRFLNEIARWGETARRRAITDEVSGLFNRRFLMETLGATLGRSSERSRRCALLCMDLDRFHEVNSAWGQSAGDAVIATVGARVSQLMGQGDIAARLSGDEFAILIPGAGPVEARSRAECLREAVGSLYISFRAGGEERQVQLTTSVGYALCPEQATEGEALMAAADGALFRAKRKGRNRVEAG